MTSSDIILASKSPRRAELLAKHGVDFVVCVTNADELSDCDDLRRLPEINAALKAAAAAELHPASIVIGADTVILFENTVIGKPQDIADAENILRRLSGRKHEVITGCAIVCQNRNLHHTFSCVSEVIFKPLSTEKIRQYISKVDVLDKAGAYAIQEYGDEIIESFSGSLENIIGLPTAEICDFLKQIG